MASALLAGRSGAHHHTHSWGESRAPLAPVPPPPNPNPNHHHRLPRADGSKRASSAASPASGYVTFRPASLDHREARALRDRLSGELGQVRDLLSRIDTWQQQLQQPKRHGGSPPPRRDLPPPPAKLRGAMRKRCGQILTKLRKDKRSVWFNAPVEVDRLGLLDYHAVIKRPMDLGTVKDNLAAGRYASHDAFAADVRLTFSNALRYNPVGHEVHTFAGALLASFDKMYKDAVAWFEEECKRLEPPKPVPAELPPPPPPTTTAEAKVKPKSVRLRKPKAREPNKREMSLEEKDLLRQGLESLPEEKMHNVLQIVRKRNNNPEMLGDEIELDIDEMDVETQWELDRFVTNFNKALKKSQRAMTNGGVADVTSAALADDSIVPENGNVPALVDNDDAVMESENPMKSSTMAEQVDEYVDIGDEMPTATYQSMEIEKNAEVASGSGGSGSGSSSSSDSESGSSGDTASGAGNARSLV